MVQSVEGRAADAATACDTVVVTQALRACRNNKIAVIEVVVVGNCRHNNNASSVRNQNSNCSCNADGNRH